MESVSAHFGCPFYFMPIHANSCQYMSIHAFHSCQFMTFRSIHVIHVNLCHSCHVSYEFSVSLCDISKISISSNNGIVNYRYRDIDSCLTDSLIFCPFVPPLMAHLIFWKSRQKGLESGAFSRFFAVHEEQQ
jgi:hypothetical protein